ncbi:trans-aconitate methyltransferase [Saccharopolyspora halophila]|uniref:Trans-aconitate methyltransferase n=1 Tax=Saccharopolyspora halophila TaxID=405551 RepID=A0ABN3GTS4_9PSEU
MTATGFAPEWLALREEADASARAEELLAPLREALRGRAEPVIRDLGCGTGSMGRWLAPRLDGPQRWVLQDRDPELLALAGAAMPGGDPGVELLEADATALDDRELRGTSLVTASALLDLLTAEEVGAIAAACVRAGCPALLTLTVAGRVEFDRPDPLDSSFARAFDAHQRRVTGGRRLLGPDAAPTAVAAFERLGAWVLAHPSPWRLGPERPRLAEQWLRGWVSAACEQQPELAEHASGYLQRRLGDGPCAIVGHTDLLAVPGDPV